MDHPLALGVWGKHVEGWGDAKVLLRLAFGIHVRPQCWGVMIPQRRLFGGGKGSKGPLGKGMRCTVGKECGSFERGSWCASGGRLVYWL